MTGYKKKIVTFLVITVMFGTMLVISLGQLNAEKPQSTGSKFEAGFLFASDPNFPAGTDDGFGGRELFFRTMFMVVLVAVLGVAAIYVSKKLLPRITNLPGKEIQIAETVHLGPRKTLHLLRIGNQWLLIGSTNDNITKLADVTDALADVSVQEKDSILQSTGKWESG